MIEISQYLIINFIKLIFNSKYNNNNYDKKIILMEEGKLYPKHINFHNTD
jgi:hypothetical protein